MSSVVLSCGESDINTDFADIKTIMEHKGKAILSIGESIGDDAAVEAIQSAIESPLLDNLTIKGAMGVLIHFTINPNFPLAQIQNAMDIIYDNAHEDADIIFGTTSNENLADNEVKITLVATGFENPNDKKTLSADKSINNAELTPKIDQTTQSSTTTSAPKTQQDMINELRTQLIGNGNKYIVESTTDLDIPTFLRKKMD